MKRHDFDAFSLVFGIGFSAVGATFLFGGPDISSWSTETVWPFVAIFIGMLVLAWASRRTRAQGGDAPDAAPTTRTRPSSAAKEESSGPSQM